MDQGTLYYTLWESHAFILLRNKYCTIATKITALKLHK